MKLTLSDCTSLCQKGHQGDAFSGLIEQTAADANGQVQRWLLYAQEAREGGGGPRKNWHFCKRLCQTALNRFDIRSP